MNYLFIGVIILLLILLIYYVYFIYYEHGKEHQINKIPIQLPIIDTIEIKNYKNPTQLVEVEVFDKEGNNIASIGFPSQNSTMTSMNDLYEPELAVDKLTEVKRTAVGVVGISSTKDKDINTWSLSFTEPMEIKEIKIWYWNDKEERKKMYKVKLSIYKNNILINERELIMNIKSFVGQNVGYWFVDYSIPELKPEVPSDINGVSPYEYTGLLTAGGYTILPPSVYIGGHPFIIQESGSIPISTSKRIRYVRLEKSLDMNFSDILSFSEVEVYDTATTNIALGKSTLQSSNFDYTLGLSQTAVDGRHTGIYDDNDAVRTAQYPIPAWWELDLNGEYELMKIVLWNTIDKDWYSKIIGLKVILMDNSRQVYKTFGPITSPRSSYEFIID